MYFFVDFSRLLGKSIRRKIVFKFLHISFCALFIPFSFTKCFKLPKKNLSKFSKKNLEKNFDNNQKAD